jgi:hypothetical protein
MELTLPDHKLNPAYFAPHTVTIISKLCCCCPAPKTVNILSAMLIILNYDIWASIGYHVIKSASYGVIQKSYSAIVVILFNIVVGIVGLCYRKRLINWVTGGSHNVGGVTIFTIRRNLNRWHNCYFLFQSWYLVIYVSTICWHLVSLADPVKNSKDKDAIEWNKDKMSGRASAFWVIVNIFGLWFQIWLIRFRWWSRECLDMLDAAIDEGLGKDFVRNAKLKAKNILEL